VTFCRLFSINDRLVPTASFLPRDDASLQLAVISRPCSSVVYNACDCIKVSKQLNLPIISIFTYSYFLSSYAKHRHETASLR